MSTLARGDQHHDHHQDNWYQEAMADTLRQIIKGDNKDIDHRTAVAAVREAESPLTSSVGVATPMQALDHLTRQYTPVTEADRKAMFVLAQFVTGMDCWSETHYQAHLRRNRLAAAEQEATERINDRRIGEWLATARG